MGRKSNGNNMAEWYIFIPIGRIRMIYIKGEPLEDSYGA